MPAYKAPLREIKFVLYELLKAETLSNSIPAYAEATPDTIDAIGGRPTALIEPAADRAARDAERDKA